MLGPDDPTPVVVTPARGPSPFVLIGDHAGRAVPRRLGDLGLAPAYFDRHIAWDIGVAGLGERLAEALGCVFIRQAFSRLVIDCNRGPDAADAAPAVSDGVTIPANAGLSPEALAERRWAIAEPYQRAIAAELDRRAAEGQGSLLVSLHSFTPVMQGFARPWRMGVLHREDSPFSRRVLALLRRELGAAAGDNQPYRMDAIDYTVPLHADARRLDYLEIETRQDLIADAAGQTWAAALLTGVLGEAAAAPIGLRPI